MLPQELYWVVSARNPITVGAFFDGLQTLQAQNIGIRLPAGHQYFPSARPVENDAYQRLAQITGNLPGQADAFGLQAYQERQETHQKEQAVNPIDTLTAQMRDVTAHLAQIERRQRQPRRENRPFQQQGP